MSHNHTNYNPLHPFFQVLPGTRVITFRIICHTIAPNSRGMSWWWRRPTSWLWLVIRGCFWVTTLWSSRRDIFNGMKYISSVSPERTIGSLQWSNSFPTVPHSLLSGIHINFQEMLATDPKPCDADPWQPCSICWVQVYTGMYWALWIPKWTFMRISNWILLLIY